MGKPLGRSTGAPETAGPQALLSSISPYLLRWSRALAALAALFVLGPAVAQDPVPPGSQLGDGLAVSIGVSVELDRTARVHGDVHSNGDVVLGRDSEVDGDVTLVGSLSNTAGSITGTVTQVSPEPLPEIPTESDARALADRIFEQDAAFTEGRIDDVVFVSGTAQLSGAVQGTGTLIATQGIVVGPLDPLLSGNEVGDSPVKMTLLSFLDVTLAESLQAASGTVLAGQDVVVERNTSYYGAVAAHRNLHLQAGSTVVFKSFDETPPEITDLVPPDDSLVPTAQTEISAGFTDEGIGVDPQSVTFLVDGVDRAPEATVTAAGVVLPPGLTLGEGGHTVELSVADLAGNSTSTSWSFSVDTVAPSLAFIEPVESLILDDPTPSVVLSFSDATSGIDPATFAAEIDGTAITDDCIFTATEVYCAPPELPFAVHTVTTEIRDRAGHQETASRTFETRQDVTAPEVSLTSPADGALLDSGTVQVTGTARDDGILASVRVNGEPAILDGDLFTLTLELPEGDGLIEASAEDSTGKGSSATVVATVDETPPAIAIEEPTDALTNVATARVSGQVLDASAITSVTVAGEAVSLTGSSFERDVLLAPGQNVLVVEATDEAGHVGREEAEIELFQLPEIRITGPADLATLATTTVTVQGTVDDPAGTVDVNGIPATLQADGSFAAEGVPLIEGGNVLTATLTTNDGAVNTTSIHVVRDLTPPRVEITTPVDSATVHTASVTVTGLVNDIVAGTVNAQEATVTVNGEAAVVSNRTFLATDVPLDLGENLLTAVAVDESGNVDQGTARVVRENPAGALRIEVAGGDLQQGMVRTLLPEPLQVAVRAADGTALAGRTVVFDEESGGGHLDGGKRRIAVTTDAAGLAAARWTLGRRAGTQQVRASAVGVPGSFTFTALAVAGEAAYIVVDAGDQQIGTAGQQLPRPLLTTVTDDGFNRLGGVPVEWTVVKGSGHFGAGQSSTIVQTDSDGRASATLVLDPAEGVSNNVVTARIAGLPGSPSASFTASGRAAGPAAATAVTGVVLDNTSRPVAGVTVRIDGTTLVATTDAEGQFRIDGAPVGEILLIVDGSTSERPGVWASLEFRLTTIPGRDSDLGMPIFLLPLDVAGGLYVDESTGGVLTVPEVPGLTLEILPGTVTFPGGSKSGVVSMTVVHSDRVPMVPNFGQQPRLIVTIQPAGARFDPPAKISYPNVEGLAPGETTDLYSFDHSLGHFVSIGPGTVSDDGTVLVSDTGVGIIKAGWHCGGDPQSSTGTAHQCGECEECDGSQCVADDGKTPEQAAPDDCEHQLCEGGRVRTQSDLTETPPVVEGNCREEICALGGPTFRADLTDKPPGLDCCGVPGSQFNEPEIFDPEGECCVEAEVLPKTPIADLEACPDRVQREDFPNQYDGCSVPQPATDALAILEGYSGDKDNPAGGSDTQFSTFPDGPFDGPCDRHDECYQTCGSEHLTCDDALFDEAVTVCTNSVESNEVILRCLEAANLYHFTLADLGAGHFAWEARQKEFCQCCP